MFLNYFYLKIQNLFNFYYYKNSDNLKFCEFLTNYLIIYYKK